MRFHLHSYPSSLLLLLPVTRAAYPDESGESQGSIPIQGKDSAMAKSPEVDQHCSKHTVQHGSSTGKPLRVTWSPDKPWQLSLIVYEGHGAIRSHCGANFSPLHRSPAKAGLASLVRPGAEVRCESS